jgi:hypothetical protein
MSGNIVEKVSSNLKDAWETMSKIREEDYDNVRGMNPHYFVDENNNPVETTPLYYTHKIDVDEVSMDIATSIALAGANMMEQGALKEIRPVVEGIRKVSEDREVKETTRRGLFSSVVDTVLTSNKHNAYKKPELSNAKQQLDEVINQQYFGKTEQFGQDIKFGPIHISMKKISDFVTRLTSSKIMSLSYWRRIFWT